MIATAELAGLLEGHDVPCLLHHAEHRCIPAVVGTDAAQQVLGHVEAAVAEANLRLGVDDRRGEALRIGGGQLEQVERNALRGLRADPRQSPQFVDERLDRRCVGGGHVRRTPLRSWNRGTNWRSGQGACPAPAAGRSAGQTGPPRDRSGPASRRRPALLPALHRPR